MTTGKLDSNAAIQYGEYPFFTCARETYKINNYAFDTEAVLLGGNNANGIFPLKYYYGKFNAYQRTYIIESLDQNILLTRYLFYALKPALSHFQNASIGATTQYLTKSILDNFKIKVPDLTSQKAIVNILSKYDDLIENNRRRIELLERSARLLYKEWFVRLRFPGHEHTPIIDGIPEGWKYLKLEEVISDIIDYRGKTPKKLGGDWCNSGIPALSALNVKNNQLINLDKCKFVNESLYEKWMKTELQKYDILMTSEAPLGELYYLTSEQKFCLSQRLYAIRANVDVIKPAMLFCTLLTPKTQAEIHSRETGTTVFGIRQSALREISILVPSIELQELATETLDSIFEQKEVLQKQNQKLKQARDILLPKLMNGEIEV
ncbi:MAG: restriction endonuclease subunit S [Microcystis aeruginosa K13-05]|nr:restriction endonuclease subunit S [Microcystis aeruginosa K13-10]NCR84554.1 restriction endonuclease subunit S [Microcystis aeruginosa K13-05]